MTARGCRRILSAVVLMAAVGCSSNRVAPAMPSAPKLSGVPMLRVPDSLNASPELLARYDAAWRRYRASYLESRLGPHQPDRELRPMHHDMGARRCTGRDRGHGLGSSVHDYYVSSP